MPARNVRFPHMDRVETVLILSEGGHPEWQKEMHIIYRRLVEQGRKVVSMEYMPKKGETTPMLPESKVVIPKDISCLGVPKQYVIDELRQQHFDLLIDLTLQSSLPLRYMALYANADFKSGCRLYEGVHDLLIEAPSISSPAFLYEQIIHYLSNIRSND